MTWLSGLSMRPARRCTRRPHYVDEGQRILEEEGIQFLIASRPVNVRGRSGEDVSVRVRTASGEREIEGSDILAAAGRVPNTNGIGLEEAGIALDARGYPAQPL